MDWTPEALWVLITGALFLAIVVAGVTPYVSLNTASFVAFGAAGVVFSVAAFALARVPDAVYPPLMWALPVLPLLIIGVLLRDAFSARTSSPQPERVTAIARPDVEQPLAASTEAPAVLHEPAGGGEGSARALANSPHATANDLARLAINEPDLRPLVARNPLTPDSVLEWLAQQGVDDAARALSSRRATQSVA